MLVKIHVDKYDINLTINDVMYGDFKNVNLLQLLQIHKRSFFSSMLNYFFKDKSFSVLDFPNGNIYLI